MGKRLQLCLAFSGWFAVLFVGSDMLAHGRATPAPHFQWELELPFLVSAVWIYLSLNLVLLISAWRLPYSILRSLVLCAGLQVLIAALLFTLWPMTLAYPSPEHNGTAYQLADWLNLTYNLVPSLHVSFAITLAFAWFVYRRQLKWVVSIWAAAVVLSTVFTHQHHLVDVLTGAVMAALFCGYLFRSACDELFWQTARAEWLCQKAFCHFTLRHRRYALIWLMMMVQSVRSWRRTRKVRYAFCWAQWIDDLLDGDWRCSEEPLYLINSLVNSWDQGQFDDNDLSFLASMLYRECESLDHAMEVRGLFSQLIKTMSKDRVRVLGQEAWPQDQLVEHLGTTFTLSLDLLLIFSASSSRASRWNELIKALAWCSVARDLEEDLAKGLINIPQRVWQSFAVKPCTWSECLSNTDFCEWYFPYQRDALENLALADAAVMICDDPQTKRVLRLFTKSIGRYRVREPRLDAIRRLEEST